MNTYREWVTRTGGRIVLYIKRGHYCQVRVCDAAYRIEMQWNYEYWQDVKAQEDAAAIAKLSRARMVKNAQSLAA